MTAKPTKQSAEKIHKLGDQNQVYIGAFVLGERDVTIFESTITDDVQKTAELTSRAIADNGLAKAGDTVTYSVLPITDKAVKYMNQIIDKNAKPADKDDTESDKNDTEKESK